MAIKSNISIIIKNHSAGREYFIANIIATQWRVVLRDGERIAQEWAFVYTRERGLEWIPPTFFVGYLV